MGLATPMEVYQSLAAEGYQMSHKRAPLSRERTPEAADLDVLYHQLLIQPEGACCRRSLWCLQVWVALPAYSQVLGPGVVSGLSRKDCPCRDVSEAMDHALPFICTHGNAGHGQHL